MATFSEFSLLLPGIRSDMVQQFAQQQHGSEGPQAQDQVKSRKADQSQEQEDALDAVLDDISSTLETDAETYVSSFVQKGGE